MAFFLSSVPPAPSTSSISISCSFSLTRPQVVLVGGSLAAVVGLFLIVPPAGKSLSKPSSKPAEPPRSLRQPLLELDLEEREKDLRRLTLSRVPTGVWPELESLSLPALPELSAVSRPGELTFPLT